MKILLADDDIAIRNLISIMLSSSGYDVTTASNGRDALEKILSENFSLLVTDKNMPELDGIKLAEEAKKIDPRLKIILASADEEHELTHIDAVITKPFTRDALIKMVLQCMKL